MPNVFEPEFETDVDPEEWPRGYEGRYARVGRPAGAERLGASLYEVPPGNSACPYHWHAANEEMLIVLERQADPAHARGRARACRGRGGRLPGRRAGRAQGHQPQRRSRSGC